MEIPIPLLPLPCAQWEHTQKLPPAGLFLTRQKGLPSDNRLTAEQFSSLSAVTEFQREDQAQYKTVAAIKNCLPTVR